MTTASWIWNVTVLWHNLFHVKPLQKLKLSQTSRIWLVTRTPYFWPSEGEWPDTESNNNVSNNKRVTWYFLPDTENSESLHSKIRWEMAVSRWSLSSGLHIVNWLRFVVTTLLSNFLKLHDKQGVMSSNSVFDYICHEKEKQSRSRSKILLLTHIGKNHLQNYYYSKKIFSIVMSLTSIYCMHESFAAFEDLACF